MSVKWQNKISVFNYYPLYIILKRVYCEKWKGALHQSSLLLFKLSVFFNTPKRQEQPWFFCWLNFHIFLEWWLLIWFMSRLFLASLILKNAIKLKFCFWIFFFCVSQIKKWWCIKNDNLLPNFKEKSCSTLILKLLMNLW